MLRVVRCLPMQRCRISVARGSAGRRRTRPEGRNRGAQAGYFSVPEYYGDLNDPGGVEACKGFEVFALKPIAMVPRG